MSDVVLIVDDEESIRILLKRRFEQEGYKVLVASNGEEAYTLCMENKPISVITDIKMPRLDGFGLLKKLHGSQFQSPVIMITGHGDKEFAIKALHEGAFDYIEKPFNMDDIVLVLKRAIDREKLRIENENLIKILKQANTNLSKKLEIKNEILNRIYQSENIDEILIGKSEYIKNLKDTILTISKSISIESAPVVLVSGETGVGKEQVAKALHKSFFKENLDAPFVSLNCSCLSEYSFDEEVFGKTLIEQGIEKTKHGFLDLANGGTLFIDEVSELSLKMQSKLLQVLQNRVFKRVNDSSEIKFNAIIIASTSRDLSKLLSENKIREDFYYYINTIPIHVAPLRSRTDDIEVLAEKFLKDSVLGKNKQIRGFSIAAIRALNSYNWPGNIRELKSVIDRAVLLESGPELQLSFLRQEHLRLIKNEVKSTTNQVIPLNQSRALKEIEEKGLSNFRKDADDELVRSILIECLVLEEGNVSSVARRLKLDRANLLRLMRRFQIKPELYRQKKAG
jgi:two-component system response regulator AtoC